MSPKKTGEKSYKAINQDHNLSASDIEYDPNAEPVSFANTKSFDVVSKNDGSQFLKNRFAAYVSGNLLYYTGQFLVIMNAFSIITAIIGTIIFLRLAPDDYKFYPFLNLLPKGTFFFGT